jgi:hypothetical protein
MPMTIQQLVHLAVRLTIATIKLITAIEMQLNMRQWPGLPPEGRPALTEAL